MFKHLLKKCCDRLWVPFPSIRGLLCTDHGINSSIFADAEHNVVIWNTQASQLSPSLFTELKCNLDKEQDLSRTKTCGEAYCPSIPSHQLKNTLNTHKHTENKFKKEFQSHWHSKPYCDTMTHLSIITGIDELSKVAVDLYLMI